jgi:hypothetical protein
MWGDWLSCVGFYRIAAESNTMSRTPADIAAGDPECLHLSVLLRGHARRRAAAPDRGAEARRHDRL